ncbi:MAG: hypothetical protein ACO3J3_02990 [Candidatus Nanopelagicales bacterium]
MSVTVIVFLILGAFLILFGVAFALYGMSSEKAYWFQRDPKGNPSREAPPFHRVYTHAFAIAVSDERAPLRIAAIGVVLVYLGIVSLLLSVVFAIV